MQLCSLAPLIELTGMGKSFFVFSPNILSFPIHECVWLVYTKYEKDPPLLDLDLCKGMC